jgi:hypothetical protein
LSEVYSRKRIGGFAFFGNEICSSVRSGFLNTTHDLAEIGNAGEKQFSYCVNNGHHAGVNQ